MKCTKCAKDFPVKPADTLMWQEDYTKRNISEQFIALLGRAAHDVANPLEAVPCPKCEARLTRYVSIGEDMLHVRVCVCGHWWPY
jgi:hypothetical protein